MKKTKTYTAYTKAVDEEQRTVEQIVSVFNNVDHGGDRVLEGAFVDSIAEWKASPDQMSAYFSHKWDDPFANIGAVLEAEELAPGDARLPDDVVVTPDGKTLYDLGGLLVKYQVDPAGQNPTADQVFFLLKERRIVQASFAYDVIDFRKNSDGVTDLVKLKILEVGPTLLGMNSATTLLSAKSLATLANEAGLTEEQVTSVFNALDTETKDANHTFIPAEDDSAKCMLCGRGIRSLAHISHLSNEDHDVKAVSFAGSVEERQATLFGMIESWAREGDIGNGGFYAAYLQATFDDRAVFLVEGWSDPWGEGLYFEAAIQSGEDGSLSMSEPSEVVVEQVVRPKAFSTMNQAKAALVTAKRKTAATLSNDKDGMTSGNEEAGNGNSEASTEGTSATKNGNPLRVMLDAEAFLSDI